MAAWIQLEGFELDREGLDQLIDRLDARIFTHESNSPDLAGESAESAADLDIVVIEEASTQLRFTLGGDSLRQSQGGQHGESMGSRNQGFKAERLNAFDQGFRRGLMAGRSRRLSFVFDTP